MFNLEWYAFPMQPILAKCDQHVTDDIQRQLWHELLQAHSLISALHGIFTLE